MATLAGIAIGAAIGASGAGGAVVFGLTAAQIGMAVGSVAGGIIDQQFVYPLIFGSGKPLDGLKIDDLQVQTASEGSPLRLCFGPNNVVPGTILWMDKITSKKKRVGGKNGVADYTYFVNVAIAICEGPVASVDKIWADGKLLWQKSNGQPGNNGSIVGTLTTTGVYAQGNKSISVSLSNNPGDAAVLKAGDHIQFGLKPTTYEVTANVSIPQGGSGTVLINPGMDGSVLLPLAVALVDWTDGFVSGLTVYKGTAVQTADPLMESVLGTGNVPGYRYIAYVVFQNLILAPFGNRLPNFTFQTAAQTTKTVASAISDILLRAGLQASDFDVTLVAGNINGYTVTGPQPAGKSLEPIMLAYNVDAQEKGAKLVFFTRTNRDIVTILESELAAHETGEPAPSPLIINDRSSFDLPNKVTVDFLDMKRNSEKGTAREKRIDTLTQSEDNIVIPIVLQHKEARDIANRLLWDSWREQQDAELALPPSRLGVQEGDLLVVPYKTETYNIRVMDAKLGANFTVIVQGRIESYTTDDRSSISEDLPATDFAVYTPPPITMHHADIPSLTDAEVRSWGTYVAVCSQDPAGEWRGTEVFYDKNDVSISQGRKLSIAREATMGKAATALGLPVSNYVWDDKNTVDVSMWNGTLISSTDLDVLNGANRMIISSTASGHESEVIGFVNAALVGTDAGHGGPIYRLSRLLRGLRDTSAGFAHGIGDICTLVNDAVYFAPLTAAEFGKTVYWRAVPVTGSIPSYVSNAFTFNGRTLSPWSPYDIRVSPGAGPRALGGDTTNVTWTWKRRTRAIDRLFQIASDPDLLNPVVEAPEKYLFELVNNVSIPAQIPNANVVLKVTKTDSTSITITGAQMTAALGAGWSLGSLSARVTQVSPLVGRGSAGWIINDAFYG